MNVNFNNVNFKGYKNPIVEKMALDKEYAFAYIATQLDNEGSADLDKWHSIQREQGVRFPKDTMTLMYKRLGSNEYLLLNDKKIPLLNDLKEIKSKSEESTAMKIYTLLAKITREMIQNKSHRKDREYYLVFQDLFSSLVNMSNLHLASQVAPHGVDNFNYAEVAAFFNKGITKTMMKYFK